MSTTKTKKATKTVAKTNTKKPATKTVAKKAPVKKATAKKTPTVEKQEFNPELLDTWRANAKKTVSKLGTSGKQKLDDKLFPSYCRAAGMQHKDVVKAVGIVRSFTHEAKEIASEFIEDNKEEIGTDKISLIFPVTGLDDGRDGTPNIIIEHQTNGVKVNTPDGEKQEDLRTTISTVHLGPTSIGRLTKG